MEALEPRQLLDGRPVASVDAPPITLWSSTYAFKVAYTDDVSIDPRTIDSNDLTVSGPGGFARTARFYRSSVHDGGRTVVGWYKISAPGGVWDAADNGTYTVLLNPHQVRDGDGNSARSRGIGTFTVNVPHYPSTTAAGMVTKGIVGVDVTRFGAIPDDGKDDTEAIQRAIDSLPRDGDGVPNAQYVMGGTVVFPKGTFNTSRPLLVPAAVRIRGQGPAATVIENRSTRSDEGAFELYSYSGHGFNLRAGIENLKITTTAAKGIKANRMDGDLLALRLNDLTISAGGVGIDLREERTYASELRNITIENPGSTAVWIGPPDDGWISNVNRIAGLNVVGSARSGFQAERAMVVLGGNFTVDGLTIGDTGAPVTPLYATGQPNIHRLQIFAAPTMPRGVLATFENCFLLEVDRVNNLGPGRRIELINTPYANISSLSVADGARLMEGLSLDGASHLNIETLRSTTSVGAVSDARVAVRAQGAPESSAPILPWYGETKRPLSQTVRDVTHWGAVPNDGIDDTAAIQAAIDAMPTSSGIPGVGEGQVGGLVLLPAGRFDVSAPLLVPSGVWLRGQGNATVLYNARTGPDRAAIEFVNRYAHGYNVGAAVEDLTIYTGNALGIRADGNISAGLIDARISGVQISAGGRAIDLSDVRAYHTLVSNVFVSQPGSSALVLGDAEGYSADNRVISLHLYASARNDFRPDRALVVLGGQTHYENGWIEHPWVRALPLWVSGEATIRGLWLEYDTDKLPGGIAAHFQDTTRVDIDRLLHIGPNHRINLVNAQGVNIDMLNLDGYTVTLRETVAVDDRSRLNIGLVKAQRDAGMLDHPRVRVESAYNNMERGWIHNRAPLQNLVTNPTFQTSRVGSEKGDEAAAIIPGWSVRWGDHLGAATGTVTVEQGPRGPRLKVNITGNPNNRYVTVVADLNIPAHLIGRRAVTRWRIDGPGQALVYNGGWDRQYSARAMHGLTATRNDVALRAGEQIFFTLPGTGVYYIENVSIEPV